VEVHVVRSEADWAIVGRLRAEEERPGEHARWCGDERVLAVELTKGAQQLVELFECALLGAHYERRSERLDEGIALGEMVLAHEGEDLLHVRARSRGLVREARDVEAR
jgi:predicted signal transduction protein with EAL and GGDEF domain